MFCKSRAFGDKSEPPLLEDADALLVTSEEAESDGDAASENASPAEESAAENIGASVDLGAADENTENISGRDEEAAISSGLSSVTLEAEESSEKAVEETKGSDLPIDNDRDLDEECQSGLTPQGIWLKV